MKTWTQFCEELGGGLPQQSPNYTQTALPKTNGQFNGNLDIGRSHLHLIGHQLRIDTANKRLAVNLSPQQVQTLLSNFY